MEPQNKICSRCVVLKNIIEKQECTVPTQTQQDTYFPATTRSYRTVHHLELKQTLQRN